MPQRKWSGDLSLAGHNKRNMLTVPKSTKKIINTMERPWGNSSEETFLTARIRL
ncbi:MAG: hypothetical protein WDO16_09985 [Bacteroidota bacterium]